MMAEYCRCLKANGERCKAPPLVNDPDHFCISHSKDPKAIATKALAVKKGGLGRAKPDVIATWTPAPITSMADLKTGLSELFKAGMEGNVSTARLSALAAVGNSLSKVIEGADLEARIEALEASAEPLKGRE